MMHQNAVEHVFSMMAATYGHAWEKSLGQAPIADVKTVWANALDGFMHSEAAKRAIVWGLKNLPPRVPNSIEFRDLCRLAPAAKEVALPAPAVNPEIAAMVIEGTRKKIEVATPIDFRAWAKRIITDYNGGLRTHTVTAVAMARRAMEGGE